MDNGLGGDNIGEDDDDVVFPDTISRKENKADENKKTDDVDLIGKGQSKHSFPSWYDPIFTQVFNDLKNK